MSAGGGLAVVAVLPSAPVSVKRMNSFVDSLNINVCQVICKQEHNLNECINSSGL
jgi:hypothetical protein